MKKLIYNLTVIFFSILIYTNGFPAENENGNCYLKIINRFIEIHNLMYSKDINLFSLDYDKSLKAGVSKYTVDAAILKLNTKSLELFFNNPDDNINFVIPAEKDKIVLSLKRTEILEKDFDLISLGKDGKKKRVDYNPGLYYTGIIKGKSESFAAVSIFENGIMGIISDERGNFVLGEYEIKGRNDCYVLYNDSDMKIKSKFKCKIGDMPDKFYKTDDNIKGHLNEQIQQNLQKLPVKMYFEADYQLYQDFNYNLNNVGDFVTGFFNVVAYMYQRENIPFTLKSIEVWTTADPYSYYEDSFTILMLFGGNSKDDFEGNLAHLLSSAHNYELGGIAWVGVLCQEFNNQDSSGRYAFSNIEPDYNGFPTYSWTVNCVTHEIGHNLGSMHTHACWWPLPNNTIGALDSCYYAEQGFCFSGRRASIGTIMSYCHLWIGQGGSVNFNLGFGPLPGDTVRLRYNQAGCLDRELNSSENPVVFDLAQNYPNPFNPTTTIKYAVPEDAVVKIAVYDLSGKEVAVLVNEFKKAGFYTVLFNASNLPSGVYFYRMQAGNFSQTKQMILIK